MDVLNISTTLAQTLEGMGIGASVKIGRTSDLKNPAGTICIIANGGESYGGNARMPKQLTNFVLNFYLPNDKSYQLYEADAKIRNTLAKIPETNPAFLNVSVGALADMDYATSEIRLGVWQVSTITITDE